VSVGTVVEVVAVDGAVVVDAVAVCVVMVIGARLLSAFCLMR
jgi:hypothetical protein